MRKQGEIYHVYSSKAFGEVRIGLTKTEKFFYRLFRSVGAGMIGFAVILSIFTFGPVIKEEVLYRFSKSELVSKKSKFEYLIDIADAERVIRVQNEAESLGVNSYFSIVIPKIEATSNVIANVDTANEEDYLDALSKGVAHAKGTYFPGQGKNIYLFSHSTDSAVNISRYNAVFFLLRKLEPKDTIIVFFADKKYKYIVEEKLITQKDDTSWISEEGEEERLILQTCDPPGTTWKRLLVIAKPVG